MTRELPRTIAANLENQKWIFFLSYTTYANRPLISPLSKVLVIAITSLLLSGCATLIRGPNTEFKVITEPAGAAVQTDLKIPRWNQTEPEFYGCSKTPCSFEISRKSNFTVFVTLDGFHPAAIEIDSGFGRGGPRSSATGTLAGATGAYVLSYSMISGAASALSAATTIGMSSSAASTGAGSAAAAGAAGVGVFLLGVDLVSGAMLDLRPNPLVLILVPVDQPLPEQNAILIDDEQDLQSALAISSGERPDDL
ncbi:MAG: hypothetical protein AAFQ15_08525 [Pseudomonadota bacterium]